VNVISDHWIKNKWETRNKEVTGYDDEMREISGASSWFYNRFCIKHFWDYESGSIKSEKILWKSYQFENDWEFIRKEVHLNHDYSDSTIEQDWRDNNWVNRTLYSTSYNSSGLPLEETSNTWKNSDWLTLQRFLYDYDYHGNIISYTVQGWSSLQWKNISREIYRYDFRDRIKFSQCFYWDPITSGWTTPDYQNTYHYYYKGDKVITISVLQYWKDDSFVNHTKTRETQDRNRNKTEVLSYMWQDDSWIPDLELTFTYDFLGNEIEETSRIYTPDSGWVNDWRGRKEYAYYYKTDLVRNNHGPIKCHRSKVFNQNEMTILDLPANSGNIQYELFDYRGSLIQSDSAIIKNNSLAIIKKPALIQIDPMFINLKHSNGEIMCKKRIKTVNNKFYILPH
jgi:hypothetical protein